MTYQLKNVLSGNVFSGKAAQNLPDFITFITAGYPSPDLTVPIMMAMESGGADIIEIGIPFSDPSADGPLIQESHKVALGHGVDFKMCLKFISEARSIGLKAPVILMGYHDSILAYGEQDSVLEAKKAGANGFIVSDLPPEEGIQFRTLCSKSELSYVPLIAPNSSDSRIRLLTSSADSFIYVISQLGPTGPREQVSTSLPDLVCRVRKLSAAMNENSIPIVVVFGISTAAHFNLAGKLANGVVVGSKLIEIVNSKRGPAMIDAVTQFCEEICGRRGEHLNSKYLKTITPSPVHPIQKKLPSRFGQFGGRYVPEAFLGSLQDLETCHCEAMADPKFQAELKSHYGYMNRPSDLYLAQRLSDHIGGARIWFKREDQNYTGSHKINNVMGQILLARRSGKNRIITKTGRGNHVVATATVCAKFGMECVIHMGEEDIEENTESVRKMTILGGKITAVSSGGKRLKDAMKNAMSDWASNLPSSHYLISSTIGPHPFHTIVRDFQSVIGREIKSNYKYASVNFRMQW